MERAFCSSNGRMYTASEFEQLSEETRKGYKASLLCVGCDDVAWFRSATKPTAKVSRSAHFNSHHHQGECAHRTCYLVIDDGSESGKHVDSDVPTATDYVINLGDKSGGAIADVGLPLYLMKVL
jgi:hypothetical protein